MSELERQLAKARARPGFMERLRQRIAEDKPILERLKRHPTPPLCSMCGGSLTVEGNLWWCAACHRPTASYWDNKAKP
jgi:predicted amidophosphoribosyltransferase